MSVNNYIDIVSMLQETPKSDTKLRYMSIADEIETRILNGSIPPGTKLPPHRILADKINVSIGTVSRSYTELEKVGLIISRVGDGSYVNDTNNPKNTDPEFRNILDTNPDVIDLSINMHISNGENEYAARTLQKISADPNILDPLLNYTAEEGLPQHRAQAVKWFEHSGVNADKDNIICTNGAQHALLCVLMSCLKSGDTIATEQLTYPGLITLTRQYGIKLFPIKTDNLGLVPEELEKACKQQNIKALFCTPTLQNPTTSIMPLQRREKIAAICRTHNILIIEDDAHGVLVKDRPLALQTFAPERTLLCTSLSKAVSSGLRVGYLLTPKALVCRITRSLRATCWMATPLSLQIATNWIEDGTADVLCNKYLLEISRRKALVEHFFEKLEYKTHPECSHFWVTVPDYWRATEVESLLAREKILIKSSEAFAIGKQSVSQNIRVSVTTHSNDQAMINGFKTISDLLLCP